MKINVVKNQIKYASGLFGANFDEIDPELIPKFLSIIKDSYLESDSNLDDNRLFECFCQEFQFVSVDTTNFSDWNPSNFFGNSPVLVFFDKWESPELKDTWYRFEDGSKVGDIMWRGSGPTHYYTNEEFSFIIGYAEEVAIYGMGEAYEWVKKLKEVIG